MFKTRATVEVVLALPKNLVLKAKCFLNLSHNIYLAQLKRPQILVSGTSIKVSLMDRPEEFHAVVSSL